MYEFVLSTAVKCNDHPTVLEILAALGIGFDCASKVWNEVCVEFGVSCEIFHLIKKGKSLGI